MALERASRQRCGVLERGTPAASADRAHAPAPAPLPQFYTNPTVKTMFKNFISTITSRVNTINGRRWGPLVLRPHA